ncbi:MAG: DNA polymerase I [Candidatus Fermentibacteria bacterium]|nr:DNA polymerase I [Candidatus Fermentibacteria bacterium]
MAQKLILVDTLSLLYRGHYAMMKSPLTGADGMVTSGLSFLLKELYAIIDSNADCMVAAVSDAPGPTFRKDLFPQYKANRPPTPDDLRIQTQTARELIPLLGIPFVEKVGLEADDIIAGFAMESSVPVLVLSPDKDLLQLVNNNVSVLRPGKYRRPPTMVEYGDVTEIMGVPAEYVADLLALMGDSSDNIPGARGIGRKGAVKLIMQFGGIDEIYRNISRVKSDSVRRKLVESRDMVELSLELTRLDRPLPPDLRGMDLALKEPDMKRALPILTRLSFSRIASRLGVELPVQEDQSVPLEQFACRVNIVEDMESIDLPGDGPVCIDTETTSVDPLNAELIGFSFTSVADESWYLHFKESDKREHVLRSLETLLNNRGYIAQNAKYDSRVLHRYGISLPVPSEDPYLADYILRSDARSHGLKKLVPFWLGKTMKTFDEVASGTGSLIGIPVESVAEYCCTDSASTLALSKRLMVEFVDEPELEKLYREIELPLSSVLADMENRGIGIDNDALRREGDLISSKIFQLMALASSQTGRSVNLASPRQVALILFDTLKLNPVRKTSKGARSTDMTVLTKLRNEHPFVETLIEFRELSKLLNTYVEKLPNYVNSQTGLIHTNFNQAVTATGRLSSSNPNLQNIPIRTSRGREIRKCFVPPVKGHIFVTADYSQIELRILAHLAGEGVLREAYRNNADIHSQTAQALFGNSDPDNRRKAKEVNFSIIYGISAFGLAQRLSVSRGEAAGIISRYYETYPEVERFYAHMVKTAEEAGETRTILGRKRSFTGMKESRGPSRKQMERAAVNSAVQGSAADIIKLAMIKVESRLKRELPGSGLVLQVHDELVLTCLEKQKETAESILREEMQGAFRLEVPLTVETGFGSNWLDAGH